MRPKLRHYVYWTVTDSGVLFRGLTQTVQLRGRSLTPWVRRLVRMLDGSRAWSVRMRGRPAPEVALWDRFLQALITAGFVVDLDQEEPDTLTKADWAYYQTVIDYIGEWTTSAAARFERFRRTPVFLHAEGLQGAIALRALVETGTAEITYRADPVAAALIPTYLAPYAAWPARLIAVTGEAAPTSGTYLWTGRAGDPAMQAAAEAAAAKGLAFLAETLTTPSPTIAALAGCRLVHAWLAQATGLPAPAPITACEEGITDAQGGWSEAAAPQEQALDRAAAAQG